MSDFRYATHPTHNTSVVATVDADRRSMEICGVQLWQWHTVATGPGGLQMKRSGVERRYVKAERKALKALHKLEREVLRLYPLDLHGNS